MSPARAARICSAPGCGVIVERGRCPAHLVKQEARREREPEQRAFYNSTAWKKLRALVRAQEPWCRICTVNPTTNVDHIDGEWRHNERENLRGLCTSCERSRTGRQHRARSGQGGS